MVIVLASAAVPEGLTFTVGQITWTTRGGGITATVLEETQIQSGMTLAPSTRPPLPRYKGKKIDGSDLLQALDRADLKLLEASRLVDGISRQPGQAAPTDFFQLPQANSCRHTRTAGNVSDDNLHPLRTVRQTRG